ncbi:MAG: LuxR C-terminal-related transcriptional regulator [Paludibacter sp.]|nr:LuxR C-terminal-related transcriptional regulator [Paludibacter sp.]
MAEQLMETAPDSALHILKRLHPNKLSGSSNRALYAILMSQALDKNDIKVESDSLVIIATDYYTDSEPERAGYAWFYHARVANNKGDANEQARNLLKAQKFAETTANHKLLTLVYADKANMYGSQRQFDSLIHYFKLSYQASRQINDTRNSIITLLNIGYGYEYISKLDSALQYFKLAEKQLRFSKDTSMMSNIYRCIGSVYFQKKDYKQAMHFFVKTPITHDAFFDYNKWYLIANVYVETGKMDSARLCLSKVKALGNMAPDYYRLMQIIEQKQGNMIEALRYANRITEVKDSMNLRKLDDSFAGLETKYRFQNLKIDKQNLIIKNNRNRLLLSIALICLSLFALVFLLWKLKAEKDQLNVQKLLVEKEKENNALLEQQLKLYNVLLLNIGQYRDQTKRPHYHDKDSNKISLMQNATFYEELIACMDIQYCDISKRLIDRFPSLSERDILICCLLLAEFNTGMIATILDVKNDSITVHRSRLRKKLQLENSQNLEEYLRHF